MEIQTFKTEFLFIGLPPQDKPSGSLRDLITTYLTFSYNNQPNFKSSTSYSRWCLSLQISRIWLKQAILMGYLQNTYGYSKLTLPNCHVTYPTYQILPGLSQPSFNSTKLISTVNFKIVANEHVLQHGMFNQCHLFNNSSIFDKFLTIFDDYWRSLFLNFKT